MDCATKYPILLLHGMGFGDFFYWGRIPGALRKHGAAVYFGHQDGNADIQDNAKFLVSVIGRILEESGAERLNIIAHSKGGLEARYLISSLGQAERIASLTTLSTPHHGSETIDRLMEWFPNLIRFGCVFADVFRKLSGDRKPHSFRAIEQFTTSYMREFNVQNPDAPGVFYQSYAAVMKGWYSDLLMCLPNLIVGIFEGENDGFLPPRSVEWTNFRGVMRGSGWLGISHAQEVDFCRIPFTRRKPEHQQISDMIQLYVDIASDLKRRGL